MPIFVKLFFARERVAGTQKHRRNAFKIYIPATKIKV